MTIKEVLAEAKKAGAFQPDARGLMPLAKARQFLSKNSIVSAEDESLFAQQWGALLSLEDGAEALKWMFSLTWDGWAGKERTQLLIDRYGAAPVLEFLVGCLGLGGMLYSPFDDVLEALAQEGSELAFEIGLRTCNTHQQIMFKATEQKLADVPPPKYTPVPHIDAWLLKFAKAHPDVAKAVLDRRVAEKDKRAKAVVAMLWPKAKKPLTPAAFEKQILAALDKAAAGAAGDWPRFATGIEDDPHTWEYFELRMLALRSKSSEDWGLVFERLSGSYDKWECTRLQRYFYGSQIKDPGWDSGRDITADFETERVPDAANGETLGLDVHGVKVKGPKGALVLDAKKLAKRDLKPGLGCELEGDAGFNLRLRAYIDVHPGVFFADAADLVKLSGVADALVICDTTAFAHTIGKTKPSKSATYRSLAHAIVTRDPRAFAPGDTNLDFRLHAKHRTP